LKKGKQLAKAEATRGKLEKASNFEILQLQAKEGKKGTGAKSAAGAKKGATVEAGAEGKAKAKTKGANAGKKK
jgi:hypothetical protein